jgi:hypothetical protein
MAERVLEGAGPVAVELVLDLAYGGGAVLEGSLEAGVDVLDVDHHRDRGAADLLGRLVAHVGEGVREHHHARTDLDFCVADLAVGAAHAHALGCAEDGPVEGDCGVGAVDAQVRDDPRVVRRDRVDLGHEYLLDGMGLNVVSASNPRQRRPRRCLNI